MSNVVRSFIGELLSVWRARRHTLRAAPDLIALLVDRSMSEPKHRFSLPHKPADDHHRWSYTI
jgi:hypothetical protein